VFIKLGSAESGPCKCYANWVLSIFK